MRFKLRNVVVDLSEFDSRYLLDMSQRRPIRSASRWQRLALSVIAAVAVALMVAIVVAIVDLYVAGHGHRSLLSPILVFEPWGISLGVGDVLLLTLSAFAAIATWYALGRTKPD
jgi:hypothetical protein